MALEMQSQRAAGACEPRFGTPAAMLVKQSTPGVNTFEASRNLGIGHCPSLEARDVDITVH